MCYKIHHQLIAIEPANYYDEGQGMEFNLTLKSSREPASTTVNGTWFHPLMDLGKKVCVLGSDLSESMVSSCGKNMIFWRKIVIFHTKYPKNFRASPLSAQFFLCAPPLT
jgi:hypothetical protein